MTRKGLALWMLVVISWVAAVVAADHLVPRECEVVVVGAGVGGLYSAYRLAVESKTVMGSKICIFEKKQRAGGRIFSVRNEVPGFEDFVVDLGAYRYGRTRHTMMRDVGEKVLGITSKCYTDPLDLADDDSCPVDQNQIVSTRGRNFNFYPDGFDAANSFANYSQDLPYNIDTEYQWRQGTNLSSPRSPNALLLGSDSILPEVASRWAELTAETSFPRAMQIVDEIIGNITSGGTYKGIPYHEVTIWQAALDQGFTAEELRLYIDLSGPVTPYTLHTHIERVARVVVREVALSKAPITGYKGLVAPVQMKDGVRRRIGMSSFITRLLDRVTAAGVKIYYNRRVVRIVRVAAGKPEMYVVLENRRRVKANSVIVNVAKPDLESLGLASEPISSASAETRQVLSRIVAEPGTKAYCFWDDAWWANKLKQTFGVFRLADETLYQGRYHDGDVVCSNRENLTGCRGALLVSYGSGGVNSATPVSNIRSYNTQPYTPFVDTDAMIKLIVGNMTAHQRLLYDDIHRQVRKAHKATFEAFGGDVEKDIPDARGCLVSDWRDYGHQIDIGAGRGGNDDALFTRPVQNLNLALVNEGWSEFRGWAEGSFVSAERALYHQYGLARPSWMDSTYHNSIIVRYNRG